MPPEPTPTPSDGAGPDATVPLSMVQEILSDRILTAPNVITVARLFLIPLFLWLLFDRDNYGTAAVVLAVMGATDWVDGQVARRWNQVSELGKILDPAADRIMLIVAVAAVIIEGSIVPAWISVPVIIREPLMFVAVPTLALLGAKRIDVTWFGKAGTFLLMFAFPLLLFGRGTAFWAEQALTAGYLFAVPGLVLSYYATVAYVPLAVVALREGRAERVS